MGGYPNTLGKPAQAGQGAEDPKAAATGAGGAHTLSGACVLLRTFFKTDWEKVIS